MTDYPETRRIADVLERDLHTVEGFEKTAQAIERGLRHVAATQATTQALHHAGQLISHLQALQEQLAEDVEHSREQLRQA